MASARVRGGVRNEHTPADKGLLKTEDTPPEKPRHGGAPLTGPHSERTLEAEGRNRSEPSPAENGTLNTVAGILKTEETLAADTLRPEQPMPSVLDLGLRVAALMRREAHLEEERNTLQKTGADSDHDGLMRAYDTEAQGLQSFHLQHTLRDLCLGLPAKTLGDVAMQLVLVRHEFDDLILHEHDDYHQRRLELHLLRTLYSALPVIIEAAGLKADDLGHAGELELWIRRHRPMPDAAEWGA